jgi:hypothetical protein
VSDLIANCPNLHDRAENGNTSTSAKNHWGAEQNSHLEKKTDARFSTGASWFQGGSTRRAITVANRPCCEGDRIAVEDGGETQGQRKREISLQA